MWRRTLCIFCAVLLPAWVLSEGGESRLVQLSNGSVRGYKDPDFDIFAFYGIPYATVPKGKHKFMAPLPPPVWLQPLEAVDKGIICPQGSLGDILPKHSIQEENCLIANIFMPDTKDKNLPVLVVVHGGGFQIGLGNWLTPKNLIRTKKSIVVTFNYRLGAHGFLCLGTENAPGNAGMKDQVALLRWVKQNIASFGGNPDDVTISGGSAGSASVDLLMLSKSARGLFKRVIPESGSHLSVFTIQSDPLENAKFFARTNNFTDVDDIYALENFYATASFDLLTSEIFFNRTDSALVFCPCVERYTGDEVFLDDSPLNILKSGKYKKVPMLHGFANMEGLLRINTFDTWQHKMNEKFSDFLPADLIFENDKQKEEVANTIKEFYFGDQPVNDGNILAYIDYVTDVFFAYPTLKSIQLQVEGGHNEIYLYEYSFVDDEVPLVPHTNVRGATHCAQTMAVLDGKNIMEPNEESISEEYKKMKSTIREMWSNFMTTGKPVPEGSSLPAWPSVKENWSPYMSLGRTVELGDSLLERRVRFWDDIYQRYYRNPVPPPTPPPRPHTEL